MSCKFDVVITGYICIYKAVDIQVVKFWPQQDVLARTDGSKEQLRRRQARGHIHERHERRTRGQSCENGFEADIKGSGGRRRRMAGLEKGEWERWSIYSKATERVVSLECVPFNIAEHYISLLLSLRHPLLSFSFSLFSLFMCVRIYTHGINSTPPCRTCEYTFILSDNFFLIFYKKKI